MICEYLFQFHGREFLLTFAFSKLYLQVEVFRYLSPFGTVSVVIK